MAGNPELSIKFLTYHGRSLVPKVDKLVPSSYPVYVGELVQQNEKGPLVSFLTKNPGRRSIVPVLGDTLGTLLSGSPNLRNPHSQ
jgi:hypothetical protein